MLRYIVLTRLKGVDSNHSKVEGINLGKNMDSPTYNRKMRHLSHSNRPGSSSSAKTEGVLSFAPLIFSPVLPRAEGEIAANPGDARAILRSLLLRSRRQGT